jgi:ABC-type nitrate/sulfonate/bicarbonate transport system substrate-binding protein
MPAILKRTVSALILAAAMALAAHNAPARAETAPPAGTAATPHTLNVVGFEGAFNLPIWVAQQHGFFAANGLTVNLSFPTSSVEVIRHLTDGQAQLALMSVDNVYAYRRGQGGRQAPDARDLVVVMGGDHGFLTLVARHGIDTVEALRGHTASVDATGTGFAFLLRATLAAHGLGPDDVRIVAAGGTGYRYRALIAGKQDVTLLRPPFEMLAAQQDFNILLRSKQLTPHYLGTIGSVRAPWAAAHRADLIAFLTAYHQALDWVFDRRNETAALAILHAQYPELSAPYLAKTYRTLTDRDNGLIFNMGIDRAGLAEVNKLRDIYAPLANAAPDPSAIDLSYLHAAERAPAWHRHP